MKHCCVIGGTGFIGSHLVKRLVSLDRAITVIARSSKPINPLPEDVKYIPVDVRDKDFFRKSLQGVNEILCLSYSSVPKTSFDDPTSDIMDNLPLIVMICEVASELHIEKLIFVSSGGTVYGDVAELPIKEDTPTNPISPYGITKLASEKYAMMFHKIKDLPVICVRPSNPYGEGQRPFSGQGFVATAIGSALENREIKIFGRDGTIRDYIYISDLVSGIISILDRGKVGLTYNVGTGVGKTNNEVLDAIIPLAQSIGLRPKISVLPIRRYDVPANILDSSKLMMDTGWRPVVPFEKGIKSTWEWYRKNMPSTFFRIP